MFSSLLRPKQSNRSRRIDRLQDRHSPSPGPAYRHYGADQRHAVADFTEAEDEEEDDEEEENLGQSGDDPDGIDDEDHTQRSMPVLPLFSETYLDSLPIYSITHAIRVIVQARTETTLTWDQIRSPQVSQFLVKPMQQQIRTQQFSRATLYCLMANCLQFNKEGQLYPGNAGISYTRALVCELLALKLLKEYNTRELIDALSYDFYPLQGLPGAQPANAPKPDPKNKARLTAARTSTLEVAIRASAKHFLAHPLVVQQLEAIWNGAISFYSSQDSLHREPPPSPTPGKPDARTPLLGGNSQKEGPQQPAHGRRSVLLYDPRQASLFKLSRLRVPRYRFFLSTLSLLVLIGLFLAVLAQRSARISSLELIFWFWSAGFMLDELVGFNEQGFSLYIMSFWNAFDLGILVLLIAYYFMRVYGVFLVDPKHWNDSAYDVLAANAILLLPRIFSVLDHYQYFSQLLIAFRLMAVDLAAVCILILIACSGFFVFFTLADSNNNAADIAFKIFQILMGFTPAAWDVWPVYNWLERGLMAFFLIICHFVVVTILITVLTNSFMKIASNAKEEHQFLFAINTISMVKNDALFSYVAPGNIFAWLLMPLRYCMPLKHFVRLNRTIIKVTHFPLLFFIYVYEKYWLAPSMFEPTDLIENHHHGRDRTISFADPATRSALFSPNVRVREESITGYQKDHALEEVFRRGPGISTLRNQRRHERRKTQHAIRSWMDRNDEAAESPNPGQWSTLDGQSIRPDWHRRLSLTRELRSQRSRNISDIRSAASDPADLMSQPAIGSFFRGIAAATKAKEEENQQTDADGDDELVTNDEEEEEDNATVAGESRRGPVIHQTQIDDYFTTRSASKRFAPATTSSSLGSSGRPSIAATPRSVRRIPHSRTMSTNTILYAPQDLRRPASSSSHSPDPPPARARVQNGRAAVVEPAATGGPRSPRRQTYVTNTRPRPIMPPREAVQTAPNRQALTGIDQRLRPNMRRLSSVDMSILSDNINMAPDDPAGGMPSSFQTQMAMALMKDARINGAGRGQDSGDSNRMSKLVLARMKTLEESFADVARELRGLKTNSNSTAPTTRRNSSGEELGKFAGIASLEAARKEGGGTERPKMVRRTTGKRPVSRKSMLEPKVGLERTPAQAKGKGKEIAHSSGDESDSESPAPTKRSSM
ncbi:Calcium channel YVC1 [Colletotrichum orbiculare MAFF 240422]|uniref:Calcium channel YVC1 n=1 Tax=Colletotrichum orbiculare (strain 104-T / ATCC 96160 / CBS 514.97 / LARS 414 / MAFF 240422) TaxID=1213857 RepID=N4UY93_COLOR|nr:Calcium channel YVC1 [Colletotrichum orbiculare MAFF 240422]